MSAETPGFETDDAASLPSAQDAADDYSDGNYDDPAYQKLHEEAEKDDRLGQHTFVVDEVTRGHWPRSGEPYRKIKGRLVTASNASCDATMSVPPTPKQLEIMRTNGELADRNRKRGIDLNIAMHKQLMKFYGKNPAQLAPGDRLHVEVGKQPDKDVKDKYYVRVVAFLDPAGTKPKTDKEVPF